jgi:putative DNA primase/helicase
MWLDGSTFPEACTTLAGEKPKKATGAKVSKIVVASFEYHDEQGNVLFVVDRVQFQNSDGTWVLKEGKPEKKFPQRRPDPDRKGKWIYSVKSVRVVPYRLLELIEAIANEHDVYICEGEAKCNLLASWNLAATCNSEGATKWKGEHAAFLKNANVILVPDNDGKGWEHINGVGASLAGIAKSVRVLVLPNLPSKGDVIDWAKAGGNREKLDELSAKAHDWTAPKIASDTNQQQKSAAEQSEDELIKGLAKMTGLAFAKERKRLAAELKVNLPDIDAELRRVKEEFQKDAPLFGHWIVEPWPEPVDGDALIRDIIRKLRKHSVVSHDCALASALWIMLAWVHEEVATFSPILAVTAAERNSGKTQLLKLISFLAPRCIATVDISRAALYRSIKRWNPSFAIDEFDKVLAADGGSDKAELSAVLNSGHTRGEVVLRCLTDELTPEPFPTFCPKAIGMIGRAMPPATLSRCIFVEVQRKKKIEDALVQQFKHKDDSELQSLRSRLFKWAMDSASALLNANPSMPDGFENRLADNWCVQFSIADLAGDDWGEQAHAAAAKIEKGSDSRSVSERALAAIKTIRDDSKAIGMGGKLLTDELASDPGSEWAEWRNGKAITQNALARLLKRFKISPDKITIDGIQLRGYLWAWFEDAWERHL